MSSTRPTSKGPWANVGDVEFTDNADGRITNWPRQ